MKRGVLLIIGVVFLVLFGLLIFLFARSGSKETAANPVVKIWAPFDEKKIYDEMSKTFLEENPNVSIEYRYIEAADAKDYEAKVVDAIASGTGPDIWLIRTDWLPKHAPKLVTMPEGLGWTSNKKETEKDALDRIFSSGVITQNSFGGAVYGLPLAVDSLALFIGDTAINNVKRELVDAGDDRHQTLQGYPKTWAELETWVRLITKKNKGAITRPAIALGTVSNTYAATDVYAAMLQQFGGAVYNTPTEVALHLALGDGTVPATRALDLYSSFSNPSHPNYTWNTTLGDPVQKFAAEELPFLIGYSSLEPVLLRLNSKLEDVGVLPLPQAREIVLPTDERTDFAAYWTHTVPRSSNNQELAWRYLERLVSQENQSYYSSKTLKPGFLNQSQEDLADIKAKDFGDTTVFSRQAFNAKPLLKPDWQFIDATLQTMLEAVRTGALAAQAAVDTAAQQLKDGP